MIFILPSMLRASFFIFLGGCIVVFIIALFYYCVCRGIGFVVRRFIS
jgi:Na+-transporting methylmalonyl-CoA/oxaloacetate decarboxylase gamma subunit